MQDEIRQAAQEAPAAIDRQRLPPSARKMARGYFERVRGPDKKCQIVEKRPTDTKLVIVGDKAYVSRDDAQKQLALVCKD